MLTSTSARHGWLRAADDADAQLERFLWTRSTVLVRQSAEWLIRHPSSPARNAFYGLGPTGRTCFRNASAAAGGASACGATRIITQEFTRVASWLAAEVTTSAPVSRSQPSSGPRIPSRLPAPGSTGLSSAFSRPHSVRSSWVRAGECVMRGITSS